MFTVLIAEKKHIDAILQENKLFFEPFLESKELAFCYWNLMGQNLKDSVPGLLDAVGRRKSWRAVVINNCTVQSSQNRNPFDVVDHKALDALTAPNRQPSENKSLEEWENEWKKYYDALTAEKETVYRSALNHPLQRLVTWLCFKQEDYIYCDVKEKQDVNDWAMEMLSKEDLKPGTILELLERDQYRCELRMKESIRREFLAGECLNIAYPSEVYCISPRSAEKNYFDPDAYWTVHRDSEYSSFVDRNMYFDRMRFMVFDMLARSHRNFRTDYIRFLASILIFISNPIPGSAMQARRLYSLETETDDTPLCTMVTSYDRKLAATYDVIENEVDRIRSEIPGELTDKDAEALFCTSNDVPVTLDESCDQDKITAEEDYGLSFDCPEDEENKWNRDFQASEDALAYIAKQQLRSVRKSVSRLNASCEISDANISRLTPLQIEDIREYTDAAEDDMVLSIPPNIEDISSYKQHLEEAAANVKKVIGRRMTRKTTVILSMMCLGLFIICFMPFIFSNKATDHAITAAIILGVGMCGVLTVIMLMSLFFLRSSVTKAVRTYNNVANEVLSSIKLSIKKFSKYLTAVCNVRRGHAVQNYAEKNVDMYTKSLRIRKKHQEDIRKKRALLEENYKDYLGDNSYCDETMSRPYEYDFDQATEYAYPAPFLAGDCRQIEFISNGNYVTVPSSYVKSLLVRMEEIYE